MTGSGKDEFYVFQASIFIRERKNKQVWLFLIQKQKTTVVLQQP